MGGARDRLGVPRLRADAVVGQGPGAAPAAVRRRRRRGAGGAASGRQRARAGAGARRATCGACATGWPTAATPGRALRRRLPALLLAGASLDDLELAPFHLLASRRASPRRPSDHAWHMETLAGCAAADPAAAARRRRTGSSTLTDPASRGEATAWWEALTAGGGEGMVVKPLDFVARGQRGWSSRPSSAAAASTCASSTAPSTPARPRRAARRGLGAQSARWPCASSRWASRRSSASSPASRLRRVHECVFGVLALESEPVDPRL